MSSSIPSNSNRRDSKLKSSSKLRKINHNIQQNSSNQQQHQQDQISTSSQPQQQQSVPSNIDTTVDNSHNQSSIDQCNLQKINNGGNGGDQIVLKRSKPIKFLETFFSNNQDHRKGPIRLDGRSINDLRQLKKNLGLITSAHGSASVSIGNTSCITGIKFELSEPELKRPNQGFLITNVDIGPICSPKFRPGPPNDLSQAIASRLYDVLISSKVIPLNSLVIKSGLAVWVLHIDVVCLSHDGNIFDTALLSILAALENARKPVVEYDFDREQVILSNLKTPGMVPLKLNLSLFPVSFAIFQETKILVDPNLFEEENSSGQITVVLDLKDGQICHLWYAGSISSLVEQNGRRISTLDYCINFAQSLCNKS